MMKHPGAPVPEDLKADYDAIVNPINAHAKLNRLPPEPVHKRKVVKGGHEYVQCHEGKPSHFVCRACVEWKPSKDFEGRDVCRACVEGETEADLTT
jgi:hypothetical protein